MKSMAEKRVDFTAVSYPSTQPLLLWQKHFFYQTLLRPNKLCFVNGPRGFMSVLLAETRSRTGVKTDFGTDID
jgi:hypothetical protein